MLKLLKMKSYGRDEKLSLSLRALEDGFGGKLGRDAISATLRSLHDKGEIEFTNRPRSGIDIKILVGGTPSFDFDSPAESGGKSARSKRQTGGNSASHLAGNPPDALSQTGGKSARTGGNLARLAGNPPVGGDSSILIGFDSNDSIDNNDVDVVALRERLQKRGVSARDFERALTRHSPTEIEVAEAAVERYESTLKSELRNWSGAFITSLADGWGLPDGVLTFTQRQREAAISGERAAKAASDRRDRELREAAFWEQVAAWEKTKTSEERFAMFQSLPLEERRQFRSPMSPAYRAEMFRRETAKQTPQTDERSMCHAEG